MSKTPLLLIGGGGHCAAVIDVIEAEGRFEIRGIVEATGSETTSVLGYPVIGTDEELPQLIAQTPHCLITVGQTHTAFVRKALFKKIKQHGGQLPNVISPLARVARSAQLGEGVVVMHYALVNSSAFVGNNCILNSRCLVEHHAIVGAHCHLSTGAILNGASEVGEECLVGSGAVILQGVSVGAQTLIGANATVIRHLHERGTYVGSPAHLKTGADVQ